MYLIVGNVVSLALPGHWGALLANHAIQSQEHRHFRWFRTRGIANAPNTQ